MMRAGNIGTLLVLYFFRRCRQQTCCLCRAHAGSRILDTPAMGLAHLDALRTIVTRRAIRRLPGACACAHLLRVSRSPKESAASSPHYTSTVSFVCFFGVGATALLRSEVGVFGARASANLLATLCTFALIAKTAMNRFDSKKFRSIGLTPQVLIYTQ